jgi:hypothetical protein
MAELSHSRASVASARVELQEQLVSLQVGRAAGHCWPRRQPLRNAACWVARQLNAAAVASLLLQDQYARVMRVAELARSGFKQSSSTVARCRRELAAAQEDAAQQHKLAGERRLAAPAAAPACLLQAVALGMGRCRATCQLALASSSSSSGGSRAPCLLHRARKERSYRLLCPEGFALCPALILPQCCPLPCHPAASLQDKNRGLKQEVRELRAQLAQMEALQRALPNRFKDGVCVQEYSFTRLGQLY